MTTTITPTARSFLSFFVLAYYLTVALANAADPEEADPQNTRSGPKDSSLLFHKYLQKFHKEYHDPDTYAMHRDIFEQNMKVIQQHNGEKKSYQLGWTPFVDEEIVNLPTGYQKPNLLQTTASHRYLRYQNDGNNVLLPFTIDSIQDLPSSVSWQSIATPVKNQGMCGSCWAFASTAVLETHLYLQTNTSMILSSQQLVSCAPNIWHCGGTGGCQGSTADLAYDYVSRHGLTSEWQFGYQSFHGQAIPCPDGNNSSSSEPPPYTPVVEIDGWIQLPRNNETVLMNAVAKLGPIAISVAASTWGLYKSGVFDMPFDAFSPRTSDINHLVVLEGYGTDPNTQEDYWLVRNSWGPLWGEKGYIRLKRSTDCGMDVTPADGIACTLDPNTGEDVVPPNQEICGTSGILFDTHIPVGVRLAPKTAA